MLLEWEREDYVSSNADLENAVAMCAQYAATLHPLYQREAIKLVAAARVRETGEIGALLDKLYESICKDETQGINALLSEITAANRQRKAQKRIGR